MCFYVIQTDPYSPILLVFFAFAVVTADKVVVFIEKTQLDTAATDSLSNTVEIHPYGSFYEYLKGLGKSVGVDKDSVSNLSSSLIIVHTMFPENIDW